VASEVGGDVYCRQCQRRIARRRCRISERNVRECQKWGAVSAAPRIGVFGRDPEFDDEARFRSSQTRRWRRESAANSSLKSRIPWVTGKNTGNLTQTAILALLICSKISELLDKFPSSETEKLSKA
jgi:hypothetical protein